MLLTLAAPLFVGIPLAAAAGGRVIAIHARDDGFRIVNGGNGAVQGDFLEFHFLSTNHSVVMGDPSAPCYPAKTGGFFSGFLPVSSGENGDVFRVTVNDSNPIYYYCAQDYPTNACAAGMVGVINADDEALEKYKCDAATATTVVIPGSTAYGGAVVPLNPKTVSYTGTGTATDGAGGPTTTCTSSTGGGTMTPGMPMPGPTATTGAPGAGSGSGPGSGSGSGPGSETGDGSATGTDVPTTNGAGQIAPHWGVGVMVGLAAFGGLML